MKMLNLKKITVSGIVLLVASAIVASIASFKSSKSYYANGTLRTVNTFDLEQGYVKTCVTNLSGIGSCHVTDDSYLFTTNGVQYADSQYPTVNNTTYFDFD